MATVADWLQGVINTMQEKADAKYQDDLNSYSQAADDWVAANVANRDNGLPLTQFTKAVPARVLFAVDNSGHITQTSATDASVKAPVLPPETPKTASIGFTTGAVVQSNKIDDIYAMLSTIYSAMGFKGAK
jgi:hypothetical protein